MFVDNEVGAGGSTGRGESVIQSCGAFQVVRNMADGQDPTEACLNVLKWIADHTKREDLLNERGEPGFQVAMYALRKDGSYGAASPSSAIMPLTMVAPPARRSSIAPRPPPLRRGLSASCTDDIPQRSSRSSR